MTDTGRVRELADLVTRLRAAGCVFAEDEAAVLQSSATSPQDLEAMVVRRVAGEPLEHVVGWVDVAGVRVGITPGVFVPRQRTALMVELAGAGLDTLDHTDGQGTVVVDLGCGTGALGLALARRRPAGTVTVHAVDVDPAAVACARRNLEGVPGEVHLGHLTDPLPAYLAGGVDVIVANMPYVPTAALALMPSESRDHEPVVSVDGGPDGLDLVREVTALAPYWLRAGGSVWVEVGEDQVAAALDAMGEAGLAAVVHRDEERGATVVSGTSRPS